MRRSDVVNIFVNLAMDEQDYKTESSDFIFVYEGKEYEIIFRRENGQVMRFDVELLGDEIK